MLRSIVLSCEQLGLHFVLPPEVRQCPRRKVMVPPPARLALQWSLCQDRHARLPISIRSASVETFEWPFSFFRRIYRPPLEAVQGVPDPLEHRLARFV